MQDLHNFLYANAESPKQKYLLNNAVPDGKPIIEFEPIACTSRNNEE